MIGVHEGKISPLCANLSTTEATERNFTVMLVSVEETALHGLDFEPITSLITFITGSTNGDERCADIIPLADGVVERSQTFNVVLTTEDLRVVLKRNVTVVTILSSDGIVNYCVLSTPLKLHTLHSY